MAYEFQRSCSMETRKYLWLICLVLASVLLIQCFEVPYRDSMLSLLSTGKAYLNFSYTNKTTNGSDIGFKENRSYPNNNSFPPPMPNVDDQGSISAENIIVESENTAKMNRSTQVEMIGRRISLAPETTNGVQYSSTISPSANTALNSDRNGNNIAASPLSSDFSIAPSPDISPSPAFSEEKNASVSQDNSRTTASVLAPVVSPSQSVVASNPPANTFWNGSNSVVPKSNRASSDVVASMRHSPPPLIPPPPPNEMPEIPNKPVVSISQMNDMLLHSRVSSFSKSPLWPSAADQELEDARFQIEHGTFIKDHPGLYAPIYRNLSKFIRSYELMEHKLKVYIYKDGKKPVFNQPRLKGIYASEGWFMKHLKASNRFVTSNPKEAHLFYLPFSSQLLVDYVYVKDSHTFDDIRKYLKNYLDSIKTRYTFWNRTDGSDHFLVACHDWAPIETRRDMANCIRSLCNADVNEGFQFGKDVSLPETYIHSPQNPMKEIGGTLPSKRKILAFFAGQMHGYLRPILLKYWENKDPDMKIVGRMRKGYPWHMKNSKYCICAKGYEVNSPRVVEALMYECVPVIISDNFVPPFFEILNWESFAVFVPEREIPNLKNILLSISENRYVVMQKRVKMVRQHFLWHNTPVKYDIFHMILHSIWYNRVFRIQPR